MSYENKLEKIDEIQKKIDDFRPLAPQELESLKEYYRIGLTYTSNALEGNSLTETETKIVIEDGLTIGGKLLSEHFEAVGHSDAYTLLCELAKKRTITEQNILELHRLFYYRIDQKNAGNYRNVKVFISGTDFVPPQPAKVPELMKNFARQIPILEKEKH